MGLLGYAALILLVSVSLWIGIFHCLSKNRPILETRPAPVARWGLFDVAGGTIAVILLISYFFSIGSPGRPIGLEEMTIEQKSTAMWGQMAAQSIVCVGLLFLIVLRGGVTLILGSSAREFFQDVVLGLGAFCTLCVPVIIIQVIVAQFVEYDHPLIRMLQESPSPEILVPVVISAVLIAPITEEFAFRLILQGWLEDVFSGRLLSAGEILFGRFGFPENDLQHSVSSWDSAPLNDQSAVVADSEANVLYPQRPSLMVLPIIVSSIIFALLHWGQGAAWIPLFFLALGLGYIYQKRRTLTPSLVVHMLLNGQSMGLLLLQIFFGDELASPPV